ncbi:unnamed protein product [Hermetia illucens]|uniref:N-acetyltransferase domain-containing protein n=2 Tax=Hermetia illucens TaxID=343691 RepID=A0A7R8YRZ6_HERIL|nr:unnamed protein product [Hermetia illucens]
MGVKAEGKYFRLVESEEELEEVMHYLEQFLPESIKFHQTIRTYLNDRIWDFYFYVTKDWPETPICLHFPGCTLTPNDNIYESFGIFCPTKNIECVDMLKDEDVLFDWSKPICLNFTHMAIMNQLEPFNIGISSNEGIEGDIYVYNKLSEDLQLEELSSDDVEMRELTTDDVKVIHDLYPANEIECVDLFKILVERLPGVGIYKKDTGEIVAWMVHSYYGAMFSMQTKPEFRRKGYGIHLARSLTKKVIERGYRPFVVIRPKNEASRNLYTKLGFERAFEIKRTSFQPKASDNSIDNVQSAVAGISLGDSNNADIADDQTPENS